MRFKFIYDANVLIDAKRGGLFDEIFEIRHDLFLSDLVIRKELVQFLDDISPKISSGKITPIFCGVEIEEKMKELGKRHSSRLSPCDLACLAHVLVSGLDSVATADDGLRKAARNEWIHPIWLVDILEMLIEDEKISKEEALAFFEKAVPKKGKELVAAIADQLLSLP